MACGALIFGSSLFCGSFFGASFFGAATEAGRCDDVAANAGAQRQRAAITAKQRPNAKFRMTVTKILAGGAKSDCDAIAGALAVNYG
jgi:hypothetical protein